MTTDPACFLIRVDGNQASAVIAGPISGAEAYAAFATASMDDDDGMVVVVPSNVTSDLLGRCGIAV